MDKFEKALDEQRTAFTRASERAGDTRNEWRYIVVGISGSIFVADGVPMVWALASFVGIADAVEYCRRLEEYGGDGQFAHVAIVSVDATPRGEDVQWFSVP